MTSLPSTDMALEVNGLAKSFGDIKALDDVSFQLRRGEFLTMLGPSGSGKTTTLRIIAGFMTPESGEVRLHGRDVSRTPPHRRNIGMVFQDYALFPHMSVEENIGFPLEARGVGAAERKKRTNDILKVVGLDSFGRRLPKQLSGGQQQRVALARALVFDPEIVLLDEPLGALDKKLRGAMQLEILRISRGLGITTISVTHDQDEALVMSDRIALFSEGRLAQIGSPRELYEAPRTEFVADFIGEANILRGRFSVRPGRSAVVGGSWVAEVANPSPTDVDGATMAIAIRPENVAVKPGAPVVGDDGGHPVNACAATVRERIYLGVEFRLVVATAGGEMLQVRSRRLADMELFGPGTLVALSWSPTHCVVLRG